MLKKLFQKRTPSDEFWNWFVQQEEALYRLDETAFALFPVLEQKIESVHPGLAFEFGSDLHEGKREFVISADGIRSVFPAVKQLVASAPQLERWKITAFRPRTGANELQLETVHIRPGDAYFTCRPAEDGTLDLVLFLRGYQENDDEWGTAGFLLLDGMIGEYDVATRLGEILFFALREEDLGRLLPIEKLPLVLDSLNQ